MLTYFKILVPVVQSLLDRKLNTQGKLPSSILVPSNHTNLALIIIGIIISSSNNDYLLTSSLVSYEEIWSKDSGFKMHDFKPKALTFIG